jgi:hypothetical protein
LNNTKLAYITVRHVARLDEERLHYYSKLTGCSPSHSRHLLELQDDWLLEAL